MITHRIFGTDPALCVEVIITFLSFVVKDNFLRTCFDAEKSF